ncbi:hypothetical protein ROLI_020180 [Roseobacter fucihabitans]|uniref:Uncharacterized protein n=2 Tax=Roseobacter fucihabitans TaxID=1537242 RepID=A0ABZ2BSC9_9RHOB|nr:hypothetical protein [Roseobacter litoralis]
MLPCNMKENLMSTQNSFETPDRADVDRAIAQAHQMRSEFISRLLKSGFAQLRAVFTQKSGMGKASA